MRKTTFTKTRAGYMVNAQVQALGHKLEIGAGNGDDVDVYHDSEYIYVLCRNHRHEYVGIEVFSRDDGMWCGECFTSNLGETEYSWILKTSRLPTIIRFLSEYAL